MAAVLKFFFRSNPDRRTTDQVLQYLKDFGHGKATIVQEGRFTVLYLHDRRDVELFKNQFGRLSDTWADLTR